MKGTNNVPLLDATARAGQIRRREVSPEELLELTIARIEKLNPALNAIVIPLFDKARREARSSQDGPFRGVPYVLKDLSLVSQGDPYVAGVAGLRAAGYRSDHDSYFVARMRAAGFVLAGRANSPELGIMGPAEPVTWGWTRNPWNTSYQLGGGGGAAAAVAAGMVPVAHGNDGGGSVRITAGQCGVVGLMPSRGRVSPGPMIRNSDNVAGMMREGLIARSVRDIASVLDIVSGHCPGDAYCAPDPVRSFATEVGREPGRLRIGVLDSDPTGSIQVDRNCSHAVRVAAEALAKLGHSVAAGFPAILSQGGWPEAFNPCIAVVMARELELLGKLIGRPLTPQDVEPVTWGYAELARRVTAEQYAAGVDSLRVRGHETERWWEEEGWDVLITPTMPVRSLRVDETAAQDNSFLQLAVAITLFAVPYNVSGQPAISLPLFWGDDGLPVGVQLVAGYGREDVLLRLAAQLEQAMPWADRSPPLAQIRSS